MLAYVDGELPLRKERKLKKHLGVCWGCRSRLSELDQGAQRFAQAFSEQQFPGPERVARARDSLFHRVQLFEKTRVPAPRAAFFEDRLLWVTACAAAVVLLVTVFAFRSSDPKPLPPPEAILSRAQEIEIQLEQTPVHQTFRVDVVQEKPATEQRVSRLEVWFDNRQGRFASRWEETDGSLKYGLWRPDLGQEYIYDPRSEKHSDLARSLFDLSEADLEQLETGFMRWLEGRRWRPVSFLPELARLTSEDGITLRVRRVPGDDGSFSFLISAERRLGETTAEIAIEVDGDTFRPRLQSLRIATAERVVALRLTSERIESSGAAELLPSVFEPDAALRASQNGAAGHPIQPSPAVEAPAEATEETSPTPAELDAKEVEVRYALHLAAACLGEPIEIVRERSKLIVRGVARSSERQTELLSALAELPAPAWLQVDIQTMESILADKTGLRQPPASKRAADPAGGSANSYALQFSIDRLPLQDQLERYFGQENEHDSAAASRNFNAFTQRVVSQSQAALDHAWALRRLTERYGDDELRKSLPRSKWLLQVMFRQHLEDLRKQVTVTRELLQPVLASLAIPAGTGRHQNRTAAISVGDERDAILQTFASVEEVHRAVLILFAGASLSEDADSKGTPARQKAPEEIVEAVLNEFPRLEAGMESARQQVAHDLLGARPAAFNQGSER